MELTEQEIGAIDAASIYAESRYDFISADDVYQEVWIWVLEHEAKVQQWRDLGDEGFGKFKKAVRNAAYDYCESERLAIMGSDPIDHCNYSRAKIRQLMPAALDMQWSWMDEAPTHSNKVTELVDIRRAYEGALSPWGKEIIDVAADAEFSYEQVSGYLEYVAREKGLEDVEVSTDAARKRVEYHLDRMRAYLGGPDFEREYTGSRKVVSSAEAANIYKRQYGG